MTGWTPDELTVLADASSLRLTAGDGPCFEVELGMVLVHGKLYVRAYRGPSIPRQPTDGLSRSETAQDAEPSSIHRAAMGRAVSRSPKESCCSPA